jgi:Cys-tRNA(Pro)/Cys-tRNA(Cys) deacylase
MTITNVMRLLKQANIPFETAEYEADESDLSGVHAAQMLGIDPDCMFKTLVAKGEKKGLHVFCIPVAEELDLKKCAQAAGEKKIEMIHVKDLLGLTGYIRGGVSPIGMKKKFPTYIDESCLSHEEITVSSGQRGAQLLLNTAALVKFTEAKPSALTH